MGIISHLFVVEKTPVNRDGYYYASELARLTIGKDYFLPSAFDNVPETDCYIYADDDDTRIFEDKCGNKLREATLDEAIELVKYAKTKDSENPMLDVALVTLTLLNTLNTPFLRVLYYKS